MTFSPDSRRHDSLKKFLSQDRSVKIESVRIEQAWLSAHAHASIAGLLHAAAAGTAAISSKSAPSAAGSRSKA